MLPNNPEPDSGTARLVSIVQAWRIKLAERYGEVEPPPKARKP
jgi:hypothetical protein